VVLSGKINLMLLFLIKLLFRYLQRCFVDKELLSMRKFSIFHPPDENIQLKEISTFKQQNMVK
jgi:hypothetical protein